MLAVGVAAVTVPVKTPVPLLVIAPAFHVPLVMVPTVAMSVPTSFDAAMLPASMAFVTLPEPMAVTPPLVIVTSPDMLTAVAALLPLPTQMLADVSEGRLELIVAQVPSPRQ